jgi:hypothetical protein
MTRIGLGEKYLFGEQGALYISGIGRDMQCCRIGSCQCYIARIVFYTEIPRDGQAFTYDVAARGRAADGAARYLTDGYAPGGGLELKRFRNLRLVAVQASCATLHVQIVARYLQ